LLLLLLLLLLLVVVVVVVIVSDGDTRRVGWEHEWIGRVSRQRLR
jgi:hypothetical protein